MNVASELRDHLQTFDEYLHTLGKMKEFKRLMKTFFFFSSGEQSINNDQLRSAVITRDDRKYYLDLKENDRGRFLRISMVGINNPRTQIAIPGQGLQELRGTLTSLIEEFGNEDDRGRISSLQDSILMFFLSDSIESPPAIGKTFSIDILDEIPL